MNSSMEDVCGVNGSTTPDSSQPYDVAYLLVTVVLVLFIGFGNILVLVAFSKFTELQTSMNVFIVSLALADLSVALTILPIPVAELIYPRILSIQFFCLFIYFVSLAVCETSILTLLIISVDRYLAIEKPLKYNTIMTKKKAKLLSIGAWVFSFGYNSMPIFGWNQWSPCTACISVTVLPQTFCIIGLLFIMTCIVSVAIVNIKIFVTANKIYADIQNRIAIFPDQTFTNKSSNHQHRIVKNMKAAKTLMLLFGVFTFCILPYGIFTLWEIFLNDKKAIVRNTQLRSAVVILVFINSGLNPIIYNRRIPEFNRAFRKLLRIKPQVDTT